MQRILINANEEELRVALTVDGRLDNLLIDRPSIQERKANIYKGKISSIEPSLEAVFVDYGADKHGFLPLKEISSEYFLRPLYEENDDNRGNIKKDENTEIIPPDNIGNVAENHVSTDTGPTDKDKKPAKNQNNKKRTPLDKLLRLGQEVVVQVQKDERGTKGAALTTLISLAGAYLVLMPNNPKGGGISRRIEGEERNEIKKALDQVTVPDGMSLIIRTAGVGRSKEELDWDIASLMRYWDAIKQAAVAKTAPYLIHRESDTLIRALRDYLRDTTEEILVDDPEIFERTQNYIAQTKPDLINRVKLYSGKIPLFSHYQIEKQIETAYQREIRLPSGASIVVDHTEALVAVDINSARATSGGDIEETALNINMEAATEMARQMRIRDIGGLIVIDFIDMMSSANQRKVEEHLKKELKSDRARIQIGRISRFGLLEMSRQRLRSSLNKTNQTTCPRCSGQGSIRTVESLSMSLLHLIEEQASRASDVHFQVQLPVNVATYIINEKRLMLLKIESKHDVQVTVVPNQHIESPHYHIKRTQITAGQRRMASYRLVKAPKIETPQQPVNKKHMTEPAIDKFLSPDTRTPPARRGNEGDGLVARLWKMLFNDSEKTDTQKKTTSTRQPQRRGGQRSGQQNRNRGGQRRGGQQRSGSGQRSGQRGSQSNSQRGGQRGNQSSGQRGGQRGGQSGGQRGGQSGGQRGGQSGGQRNKPKSDDSKS